MRIIKKKFKKEWRLKIKLWFLMPLRLIYCQLKIGKPIQKINNNKYKVNHINKV